MADAKNEFEAWLKAGNAKKFAPSFCVATIEEVSLWAIEKSISKIGLFEITNYRLFNEIRSKLTGNKIFRITRKSMYKAFEKISNSYTQFLKERESGKFVYKTEAEKVVVEQVQDQPSAHVEMPIKQEVVIAPIEPTFNGSADLDSLLLNFWEFLKSEVAANTAQSYYSSTKNLLKNYSDDWAKAKESNVSTLDIARDFYARLQSNSDFVSSNSIAHNQQSVALKRFISYLGGNPKIDILQQPKCVEKRCGVLHEAVVSSEDRALAEQIIIIVKKKGINGAWVDKDIFPFVSATKRAVWDILNTNEKIVEVPRCCFVHNENIVDLDEAREVMLKILRGHFARNNGVSTSRILYKAVQTQLPIFLNDNDFDDEEKVYCIAKYLFSKCGTEHFGFYMNQYVFENESDETKSIFGLLVRLARQNGGFLTADDAKNYLSRLELSDNLTQCLGLNSAEKRDFLQYTDSEFLYFPSAQFDDEQVVAIGHKLDKLFTENFDDGFVVLRDITDEWFSLLPSLPCGKTWTPLFKNTLPLAATYTRTCGCGRAGRSPPKIVSQRDTLYAG
jgi:hypothetical protein